MRPTAYVSPAAAPLAGLTQFSGFPSFIAQSMAFKLERLLEDVGVLRKEEGGEHATYRHALHCMQCTYIFALQLLLSSKFLLVDDFGRNVISQSTDVTVKI